MFCQKCGKEIPANSRGCPICETINTTKQKRKINPISIGCIFLILLFLISYTVNYIKKTFSPPSKETQKITSIYLDIGDEGYLIKDCMLGVTKESYDEMLKIGSAKDKIGFNQLFLSGKIFKADANTKVLVIDRSMFLRKIRILEGPQMGLAGWLVYEDIRK